jgi:leucyl/phenylalanyl-tRNA--protein transferase
VPVFQLTDELAFPHPRLANRDGLLAVGGDLSRARLLLAYSNGIFPWFAEEDPILWWSPSVRPVVAPGEIHVGRSLAKAMRRRPYDIRFDTAFQEVIAACASAPRPGQEGTWITRGMQEAYLDLHEAGFAHSVEAWQEGRLVGGLYGVALGGAFFGESMFARAPDASKIAFVVLCRHLEAWGFGLIDSQVTNEHTARFGTVEIPRDEFLVRVRREMDKRTRRGKWTVEEALLAREP